MPARPSREDHFITCFLLEYENGSWADAAVTKPDALDRENPAVDKLAVRKSDDKTLAIEHTIIQPFVEDKADFASFQGAFLPIEKDESLPIPGHFILVFVPVGTLDGQPQSLRSAIVQSIHDWIKSNRLALPLGRSIHRCPIASARPFDIELNVEVVALQASAAAGRGDLYVRRQQVADSLGEVIEKMLRDKIAKLVNTQADKRILLLERQHMNLYPKRILEEIEKRRSSFAELKHVDEIWFLETIFYGTAFGENYIYFELYENGEVVQSFDAQTVREE